MINNKIIAEKLLSVQAVKLSINNPYTWASGWQSPIYCDNRKLLSFPIVRDYIKSELCAYIFENFENAQTLAGVATAGIPWGIMVADQLKYPFVYIRPKSKEHGMKNQIEGNIEPNTKIVVIEDLISTGKSSFQAIQALLDIHVEVIGLVSIFDYGFSESKQLFNNYHIPYYSLTNFDALIEVALQKNLINNDMWYILNEWKLNPSNWK